MKQNFTVRQGALDGVEAFLSVEKPGVAMDARLVIVSYSTDLLPRSDPQFAPHVGFWQILLQKSVESRPR